MLQCSKSRSVANGSQNLTQIQPDGITPSENKSVVAFELAAALSSSFLHSNATDFMYSLKVAALRGSKDTHIQYAEGLLKA